MTFTDACLYVQIATAAVMMGSILIAMKRRRRIFVLKGRIISRWIVRMLGWRGAFYTQSFFLFVALGVDFAGAPTAVARILWIFWNVWVIDDCLNSDDDRWKRWRDKAKARLKKIKPVRLRPAERWAPSPA